MAQNPNPNPPILHAGDYLGEISALAFLPTPAPLLLAGTGSQILLFDLPSGSVLASFHVLDGVRVHGIVVGECGEVGWRVVVFGEKKVKLVRVRVEGGLEVVVESGLPRFDHWVLDALFVEEESCLAIGLGDNSLAIWDIAKSNLVSLIRSPDKCLLYSLRLWGHNLENLRVASGTIYNEIIVWKLVNNNQVYEVTHLSRLSGHDGSIFRLAWSHDGAKLMSVSDDRSARIWIYPDKKQDCNPLEPCSFSPVILYGHDARIWDCYNSDTILITVGEDCTCRVWGTDGKQQLVFKEHIGRGIWRCLYDPVTSVLVTAGFDSAIKVHKLYLSSIEGSAGQIRVLTDFKDRTEIFTISYPNASIQLSKLDSKSEYVRCLVFTRECVLYVATNNGFLYHVNLENPRSVKWNQLCRICEEAPLICMDLMSAKAFVDSTDEEDMVVIGDGKGNATVLRVSGFYNPKVEFSVSWLAEAERQLLGVFWCKCLGCNFIFTANPRGTLKLWSVQNAVHDNDTIKTMPLIAAFSSSFGTRITCLSVSLENELLICGDQRGNLTIFLFLKSLLIFYSQEKALLPVAHFKGAHGISSVTTISVGTLDANAVEIRTTGGDGCICFFKLDKISKDLEFVGMKQVKELSIIRSLVGNSYLNEGLVSGRYAVGFTSSQFIIWSLTEEMEVSHIACGGWRRPYSFYFGSLPEIQNCFAFLKDHNIHIHRLWVPSNEKQECSKVLHMQSHGREIHTLGFVCFGLREKLYGCSDILIATGCEDGTVRLTRYNLLNVHAWSSSSLLGEHVGGSAVRSICFASEVYTSRVGQNQVHVNYEKALLHTSDDIDSPFLLISVGAKQVLTSWLLRNRSDTESGSSTYSMDAENMSKSGEPSPISFQWLSTHVPAKHGKVNREIEGLLENTESIDGPEKKSTLFSNSLGKIPKPNTTFRGKSDDDWRYLAVTAFLVKAINCRSIVCFIVVASSDATLTLRALLLPHRLWFDVALFVPQAAPVLALQHVVLPVCDNFKSGHHKENVYVAISGSTDGTITFWDLTESVEHFMQSILELQPEKLMDCQKRPRTGRGSQGGRWWKLAPHHSLKKKTCNDLEGNNTAIMEDSTMNKTVSADIDQTTAEHAISSHVNSSSSNTRTGLFDATDIKPSDEICDLQPLFVLNSVHQSGVNCLHISKMNSQHHLEDKTVYCVLSGGDDQSLHSTVFTLEQLITNSVSTDTRSPHMLHEKCCQSSGFGFLRKCTHPPVNNQLNLKVLYKSRVSSAHSSAVKGVWTDATWVFSTGLDQRIRCWHISDHGELLEHGQLIICVPEPETLDAVRLNSNQYQIAVAGRGVQMVIFNNPNNKDAKASWS